MIFQIEFVCIKGLPGAAFNLEKKDCSLLINNEVFDFSNLLDGASIPDFAIDSEYVSGEVSRNGNAVRMRIIYPYFGAEIIIPNVRPVSVSDDGPIEVIYEY